MIGVTTEQLQLILESLNDKAFDHRQAGEGLNTPPHELYGLISKALERFGFSGKPTTKEAS